jgi:archaellum component FlaC
MDLTYIILIGFSIYALFDGIGTVLQDKEIEEINERLNRLEKEIKKVKNND